MMEPSIKFNDACYYKGYYYFSNLEFNSLFRIKENFEESEFLGVFENESSIKTNIHNQVLLYKDKLYFIPLRGRGITVYNLTTGNMNFIDLHCEEAMISYAFILYDWMYLIPMKDLELTQKINLADNSVYDNTQLRGIFEKYKSLYFCDVYGAAFLNNCVLYMVLYDTGKLLQIDLVTYKYDCLDYKNAKFDNVLLINDDIWITSTEESDLYKVENRKLKTIKLSLEQEKRQNFRICENQGYLYCLPCFGNTIFVKRIENDNWESMEKSMPKEFQREIIDDTLFMGIHKKESSLFLFPKSGNGIIEINGDVLLFRKIEINQSEFDKCIKQRKKYIWKDNTMLHESGTINLECFINLI